MVEDREFSPYQLGVYKAHLDKFAVRVTRHPNDINPENNPLHFADLFLSYVGRNRAYQGKLTKLINRYSEGSRDQKRRLKRELLGGERHGHTAELKELLVKTDAVANLYAEMFGK